MRGRARTCPLRRARRAPGLPAGSSRDDARPSSFAREPWSALLQKCRDAFAVIGAAAQLALQIALHVELLFETVAARGVERALDRGQSCGGRAGQRPQKLLDRRGEIGVIDAMPDKPPLRRLLAAELLAEHRQTDRAGAADQPRKKIRAARVRDEPDLAERLNEARRLRGDDDVAGERDVRAGAGGNAVHRT